MQWDDESIDPKFDDLVSLSRSSDPGESTYRKSFSITSKFIDGVKKRRLENDVGNLLLAINGKSSHPSRDEAKT